MVRSPAHLLTCSPAHLLTLNVCLFPRSAPQITGHVLSPNDLVDFLSGMGISGVIPSGLPPGIEADTSQGGVVVQHVIDYPGIATAPACYNRLMQHESQATPAIATGTMGLFFKPDISGTTGYCRGYRVVRSSQQHQLWTSWSTYARTVTDLSHFQPPEAITTRVPVEAEVCTAGSTNCVWWAEFDDSTYSCSPLHDGANLLHNVLTPLKMIETLEEIGVYYPPPLPPPPTPPASPNPPPPPPMRCMDSQIPRLPQQLTIEVDGGQPFSEWTCWRWVRDDERAEDFWPPQVAHRNTYVQNDLCPREVSDTGLSVTRTINRETFYMFNRDSLVGNERESAVPSGAAYPDCEDASDHECCIAYHQIKYNNINFKELYTTKDIEQHATIGGLDSGCMERCALERRNGFPDACLPAHDECMDAEAADPESGPDGPWIVDRFVDLLCICGGRFSYEAVSTKDDLYPQSGVHGSTVVSATRDVLEAVEAGMLPASAVKDDNRRELVRVVDTLMGAHLEANDTCRRDLLDFKLRLFQLHGDDVPNNGRPEVCNIDAIDPYTQRNLYGLCDNTTEDKCCRVNRHADHRSMWYPNLDGTGQKFGAGVPLSEDVYGPDMSAIAVADVNNDEHIDIVTPDGVRVNDGSGGFSMVPLPPSMASFNKLYVADMDSGSTYPDIVGLDADGRAYIARSSVHHSELAVAFEARLDTARMADIYNSNHPDFWMRPCVYTGQACRGSGGCPSSTSIDGGYLDEACYHNGPDKVTREIEVWLKPTEKPLWRVGDVVKAVSVTASHLAGSTCDADKFLNTDMEITSFRFFDDDFHKNNRTDTERAEWTQPEWSHPRSRAYHRLKLRFVDDTECTAWPLAGLHDGNADTRWRAQVTVITFKGTPKGEFTKSRPTGGQTPTFYPPQRIGDVGDHGAIDVAATQVETYTGSVDEQRDICLLFRGRPVKCFVLPVQPVGLGIEDIGEPVLDSSNVLDVVYLNKFDTMNDAIQLARIVGAHKGQRFTPNGWQLEGEILRLNWEDDAQTPGVNEQVAPGISVGSVISIVKWENATFDVSFIAAYASNRFKVIEAGEFYIKVRISAANWKYKKDSWDKPYTGTNSGDRECTDFVDRYEMFVDAGTCPRLSRFTHIGDSPQDSDRFDPANCVGTAACDVQVCDVYGALCKTNTDKADCRGPPQKQWDTIYSPLQSISSTGDDTCPFSQNGICESHAGGDTMYSYGPGVGAGSRTNEYWRSNNRYQRMSSYYSWHAQCPKTPGATHPEDHFWSYPQIQCWESSGDSCGDGVMSGTSTHNGCAVGLEASKCGERYMTYGLDVTVPLRDDGSNKHYRGQGAVTFDLVEAAPNTNVGTLSSGSSFVGDDMSGVGSQGFTVVREHSQPTLVVPRAVTASQSTGDEIPADTPSAAVFGTLRESGPTLVLATADGHISVYKDAPISAARVMSTLEDARGGAQDVNLCKLHSGATDGELELVVAGDGTSPRVFNRSADGTWSAAPGQSVVLDDALGHNTTNPKPYSVRIDCADFNGDGLVDVLVHRTAENAASCAYRCYELGRWGYDIARTDAHGSAINECLCGPHLSLAQGPKPPPSPPPLPTEPPPPPVPPFPENPPPPCTPPTSPPIHKAGLCIRYGVADFLPPSPPPVPTSPPPPFVMPPPLYPPFSPWPSPPPNPPPPPSPPPPLCPPPPSPPSPPPSPPKPPPPPSYARSGFEHAHSHKHTHTLHAHHLTTA